ncbi:hypothetical protein [Streptomyces griseosporeus]|uniref:hypothetical protein n=1 Tax=Streptomyces griseosporeus TaxID=1910 RepID=UPI00167CAF77|nr:hypothetical protein [Streptomyces griseosporeus]GHF92250.1 hypothetical protein GCM10018783_73890 [Streptomyces griseosporeus]
MADRIVFDLPLWSAEIYHSERGTVGVWNRVFNLVEVEDEEENEKQAVKEAVRLFVDDGLDAITIYRIEVSKLMTLEGGEDADLS